MERKTIVDIIDFENAKPALLFNLYTNAALHTTVTEAPATITDKLGDGFNVYGGFCFGENIEISKDKLIIQSWRTNDWFDGVDDSILILFFVEEVKRTRLYLTHANLPKPMAASLKKGWETFYWEKWRRYIKGNNNASYNYFIT